MTTAEKAAAARALADELFKGPCKDAKGGAHRTEPCLERQRKFKDGTHRPFDLYDHNQLCDPCRPYWFVEMAAQSLERQLRFEMIAEAEKARQP